LDISSVYLLEHPYATQQHDHPQEHAMDVGLRLAVKKRTAII
jgi:hypothetical protein